MKNKELHAQTQRIGQSLLNTEELAVRTLIRVQEIEAYRDFNYKGLYTYIVEHMKLSDSVAQMFRLVVNCAIALPALKSALIQKKISVVYASRIASGLTPDNIDEVLKYAEDHSIRETEAWLVKEKGVDRKKKISISAETLELLRDVVDIMPGNPSQDDVLRRLLRDFYHKNHPVEKAKRAQGRPVKKSGEARPAKTTSSTPKKRKSLTAAQQHAINLRDDCRCTFVGHGGVRCDNKRWFHHHHVVTIAEGGTNDPDNILTLCPEHHDLVHQLSFPLELQQEWFPKSAPIEDRDSH